MQHERTSIKISQLVKLYGIKKTTYYRWKDRDGSQRTILRSNKRAILVDEVEEKIRFRQFHPNVGYRKFTWMLNDAGVVFLAESAVYKVLSEHNLLGPWHRDKNDMTSKEYQNKPKHVHHHWHTDICYIKIRGVFYFLIMVLDGYSRFLLGWRLMTDMTTASVQDFIQEVKDRYPHAKPMLISDNGSQFISKDFKILITQLDIQQVRTRRNHPETNGKAERWNASVKNEAIRPNAPTSYQEALDILNDYSYVYNYQRLHAGIKYLRPADLFFGRADDIINKRKQNIADARKFRIMVNSLQENTP